MFTNFRYTPQLKYRGHFSTGIKAYISKSIVLSSWFFVVVNLVIWFQLTNDVDSSFIPILFTTHVKYSENISSFIFYQTKCY